MSDCRNSTKCLLEAMSFKMHTSRCTHRFNHATHKIFQSCKVSKMCSKQRIMVMLSPWIKGHVFLPDPLYLQGVVGQVQAPHLEL